VTEIVVAEGLGKRYGSQWALRDCTLQVPSQRAVALVGPNGAGKTTLLQLLAGLLRPSEGWVRVAGGAPFQESAQVLPHVAFVAQEQPLYRDFTGAELLTLGAHLNPRWDDRLVRERLRSLGVPLDRPVGRLSGGQRSQVALALSLAKQAELVLLDEPLASLDPLARQEFLQTLMETMSEAPMTLVLSSHIVGELERVCDWLAILTAAHVQLSVSIEEALATHHRVVGPASRLDTLASLVDVIVATETPRQTSAVVRASGPIFDPAWEVHPMTLEEIVLAYLTQARSPSQRQGRDAAA
jgi:ABC-2 type transport system ATP-binding protein